MTALIDPSPWGWALETTLVVLEIIHQACQKLSPTSGSAPRSVNRGGTSWVAAVAVLWAAGGSLVCHGLGDAFLVFKGWSPLAALWTEWADYKCVGRVLAKGYFGDEEIRPGVGLLCIMLRL